MLQGPTCKVVLPNPAEFINKQAKLKVDRAALLQRHSISQPEFAKVTASMLDLCFDILVRAGSHCNKTHRNPCRVEAGPASIAHAWVSDSITASDWLHF